MGFVGATYSPNEILGFSWQKIIIKTIAIFLQILYNLHVQLGREFLLIILSKKTVRYDCHHSKTWMSQEVSKRLVSGL